ncbi:MAG: aminotransferase class I/II-fold pyridoxal phosphate-dependent enzyme [candidate division Zixibacteria bacterium]|nr:aminotransferase class I/II-fold pyridoxal phosphate-dependent enzyme [candidate division Zixibacteria bacterium]
MADNIPVLSQRAMAMPASPIRKLVPHADAAKERGIKVYHLNIGQPDIPTPDSFWNAVKNYDTDVLAYGHSQGLPSYRKKLAKYYQKVGYDVQPDNIVVTTAGSEAIIFCMMALCSPGEELVVPEPFYTNYNGFAVMSSVHLVPITCKAEDGFHLPPKEEIAKLITDKTRGIVYCSPNNPTGAVFTRDELQGLADLAREHNLFLMADEVYREFIYEGEHTSVFELEGIDQQAIILDSISKRYSACGARVGCIVTRNNELVEKLIRFGQARLCPPTLEQAGAEAALDEGDEYFEETMNEYKKRRDVVYDILMQIPDVVCLKPSGAFYIMAKLPVDNADAFAQWMLTDFSYENATTMIAPGSGFYATPNVGLDEARIAYVLNVDDLRKAMETLKLGIEAYNRR